MKKQKFNLILLGIVMLLTVTNCTFPKCSTPPEILQLRIISKTDSTDLISSGFYIKDSISVYYLDKNVRKEIAIQLDKDLTTKKTILSSNNIAWKSLDGFKDFYLYLNYKDIDTMYLDVVKKNDGDCTYNPINSFKYNGQVVQLDNKEYLYKLIK